MLNSGTFFGELGRQTPSKNASRLGRKRFHVHSQQRAFLEFHLEIGMAQQVACEMSE